jgi:hypothetical protein
MMISSARTKMQQLLVRTHLPKTTKTMMMKSYGVPSMGGLLLRRSSSTSSSLSLSTSAHPRILASYASSSSSFDETTTSSSSKIQSFLTALSVVAAATIGLTNHDNSNNINKTDCCGIVGVVGTTDHGDAREFLLDGLTILKNRGYDSAGIATIPSKGGEMHITKFASDGDKADSIELVGKHSHSMGHTLGIAHTRWYVDIYLYINCVCVGRWSVETILNGRGCIVVRPLFALFPIW